jgi:hypothetical protein
MGSDVPDAPPPLPPPEPTPVFLAGSPEDPDVMSASGATKKGKDALKTNKVDTGLGIPTGV